jgi:hypothetical protein
LARSRAILARRLVELPAINARIIERMKAAGVYDERAIQGNIEELKRRDAKVS